MSKKYTYWYRDFIGNTKVMPRPYDSIQEALNDMACVKGECGLITFNERKKTIK